MNPFGSSVRFRVNRTRFHNSCTTFATLSGPLLERSRRRLSPRLSDIGRPGHGEYRIQFEKMSTKNPFPIIQATRMLHGFTSLVLYRFDSSTLVFVVESFCPATVTIAVVRSFSNKVFFSHHASLSS